MAFAVKTQVDDPVADLLVFDEQKTMYAGKSITKGDLCQHYGAEDRAREAASRKGRA